MAGTGTLGRIPGPSMAICPAPEPFGQVGHQTPAPGLHHLETGLEVEGIAVIGVGNVDRAAGTGVEPPQHDQPIIEAVVARLLPGQAQQGLLMAAVHAHHQIGVGEPRRLEGLGPVPPIAIAPTLERRSGPRVHRLTGMPTGGAGAGDDQVLTEGGSVGEQGRVGQFGQHHGTHGRSADIAGADEADGDGVGHRLILHRPGVTPVRCPESRGPNDRSGEEPMSQEQSPQPQDPQQMGHGVKQRDQIKMTPEEIDAFLHERRPMTMCTLNHDGSIHAVAMWYGFLDGSIAIETKAKAQKAINLGRDSRITCMFEDGEYYEELRGVELVGRAEIIDDPDKMFELGVDLFERYYGAYTEELRPFVETMLNKRIVAKVNVERTVSWDHRKLGLPSTRPA